MENWLLSDKEKSYDIEWLVQNNEQMFDAIVNHLKSKDEKIISRVCSRLSALYKEKDTRYQFLVVNAIPILINYYFVHFYEERICSIIEVCLLTIYNLSLSDENMKLNRIRIPNLSLPSIYHSPQAAPIPSELSESALQKLDSEFVILEDQFKPYLDTINSEKRFNLIRFLLLLYLSRLPTVTKQSKLYFCDSCLKICKINRGVMKTQPIYLNSQILIEMLNGLYYLFNNGLELDAYIAIEAISAKADEELLADVMLMCNSIKNLIHKSKKEPINLKDMSAIQESRRKMSDNPTNPKQIQQELLHRASIKPDAANVVKDAPNPPQTSVVIAPSGIEPDGRQASIDESLSESVRNIPVIDENEDSSSSYSLAEKL